MFSRCGQFVCFFFWLPALFPIGRVGGPIELQHDPCLLSLPRKFCSSCSRNGNARFRRFAAPLAADFFSVFFCQLNFKKNAFQAARNETRYGTWCVFCLFVCFFLRYAFVSFLFCFASSGKSNPIYSNLHNNNNVKETNERS